MIGSSVDDFGSVSVPDWTNHLEQENFTETTYDVMHRK